MLKEMEPHFPFGPLVYVVTSLNPGFLETAHREGNAGQILRVLASIADDLKSAASKTKSGQELSFVVRTAMLLDGFAHLSELLPASCSEQREEIRRLLAASQLTGGESIKSMAKQSRKRIRDFPPGKTEEAKEYMRQAAELETQGRDAGGGTTKKPKKAEQTSGLGETLADLGASLLSAFANEMSHSAEFQEELLDRIAPVGKYSEERGRQKIREYLNEKMGPNPTPEGRVNRDRLEADLLDMHRQRHSGSSVADPRQHLSPAERAFQSAEAEARALAGDSEDRQVKKKALRSVFGPKIEALEEAGRSEDARMWRDHLTRRLEDIDTEGR